MDELIIESYPKRIFGKNYDNSFPFFVCNITVTKMYPNWKPFDVTMGFVEFC